MGNRNNDELVGFYRNLPNRDGIQSRFLPKHGLTEKETKKNCSRPSRKRTKSAVAAAVSSIRCIKKPLRY